MDRAAAGTESSHGIILIISIMVHVTFLKAAKLHQAILSRLYFQHQLR